MTVSYEQVDPTFREVWQTVLGDAVDVREAYELSKFAPAASDLHVNTGPKTEKDKAKERKLARVGLGGTALAGVAGTHGLVLSAKKYGKDLNPKNFKTPATKQLAFEGMEGLGRTRTPVKAALVGGGLIGLHAAELGADALAGRALHRQLKENKKGVHKADISEPLNEIIKAYKGGGITKDHAVELAVELVAKAEQEEISKWTPPGVLRTARRVATERAVFAKPLPERVVAGRRRVGRLNPVIRANTRAKVAEQTLIDLPKGRKLAQRTTMVATGVPVGYVAYKKGKKTGLQDAYNTSIVKSDEKVDYGFQGEISKVDSDKRLAFGWCSLSEIDGQPVVDLQDDYAPIDEIEKSAYAYVKDSRVGGDMHARDGEMARHTSDLVESFIATPEKLQQMGLSEELAKSVPTGWWVGFHVKDDEQWAMVKDGRRAGFSIHGKGSRVSKVLDA